MTRRRARGFSLLELLVATTLVGVLASVTVPSFANALARQRLKSVAGELANDLAQARFDAVQRQQTLHVAMRAGPDWCWAVATAPVSDCRTPSPAMTKQVRAADHPGVSLTDTLNARFDPTPASVGAGLGAQLQGDQGGTLRVQLTPLGRASICSPDGMVGTTPC